MYSVIVGSSPQTGHAGSRLSETSVKDVSSASKSSSRPTSGSPSPSDELQRLVRLERADDPGQHAEDAALGAARRQLGRRRGGEEAAVARAVAGLEHGHLALEAVDRAVDERDVVPDRRVVQQVARREVVGAVDDHVPALAEDAVDVLRGDPLVVGDDLDVGIERLERALRGGDLRLPEPVGGVDDLALQVGRVDDVGVDDPELADARGREVERRRRAEAAGADEEHARVEQLQLAGLADLRDEQVAAVARVLLRAERARELRGEAVALPVGEAAGEVDDARVAELLERLRGERGARADRRSRRSRAGRGPAAACSMRLSRLPRGIQTAPGMWPSSHSSRSRTSRKAGSSERAAASRGVHSSISPLTCWRRSL